MFCWKCGAPLESQASKIPFKAICDVCNAWLHCCRNCVNYRPGLPNDCAIPGTDSIADRELNNYCEEFVVLGKAPPAKMDPDSVSKKLFGESLNQKKQTPQDRFKDLFGE